jgi:isoleucyl-tRNA synthetase
VKHTQHKINMFQEPVKKSFPEIEESILELWNELDAFQQSIKRRSIDKVFSFYDGPPFATGLPHYGHLLAGTIKDAVLRGKTMQGFRVERRFGWDCHGLPIENLVEKELNLSGAADIEQYGIANFNEACRDNVFKYTKEWRKVTERIGRWVDFDKTYHTMDVTFMESVWWAFKSIFDKGLIYEGYKVMPFSWKLGTPLSNFEATENYKDVDDPSVVVTFESDDDRDTYFLAWTTTPWTLISNMALGVNPELAYVKVSHENKYYIMAKARYEVYQKEGMIVIDEMTGVDLVGQTYKPLFANFENKKDEGAFKVCAASFVTVNDGTGIVHLAPAFGEDDFQICKENKIPMVCPIDENGEFTSDVTEYQGSLFFETNKLIIKDLKNRGLCFHHATIRHRYPFCWRSDTPLIYRATSTWFVSVEQIKSDLISNNQQIHWVPGHIKDGRFGKWLEGARDWCISRNRFWGTPIPIWQSDDGDMIVIGSLDELQQYTTDKIDDIHRHFIDDIVIEKNGKSYKRIPEVFDCWFESGSMPYAQNHYPFVNKEQFESNFPADFIAEGLDQTRGWFYTLNVLSTILFNKPAFKHVIVNGIILAENGTKMSKRLKNYPEPTHVLNSYGADALRLYLFQSPAVRAEDMRFSEAGIQQVMRQILIPWYNAYSFFLTYASMYEWKAPNKSVVVKEPLNRWMISRLNTLVSDMSGSLDTYILSDAVHALIRFIDQLTNWYIRRSRRVFWADDDSQERQEAFYTLHLVLVTLSKVSAPFMPFLSEEMYQGLTLGNEQKSVHWCDFPKVIEAFVDDELESTMRFVRKIVNLGHALRKQEKIKVRQPLQSVTICLPGGNYHKLNEYKDIICDELNVKDIIFVDDPETIVTVSYKPNYRVVGKKVLKLMSQAAAYIKKMDKNICKAITQGEHHTMVLDGEHFVLDKDDLLVDVEVNGDYCAMVDGELTVAINTIITEDLEEEGFARELVNKINTFRKQSGYAITDRIKVVYICADRVDVAISKYTDYISSEVLATQLERAAKQDNPSLVIELNESESVELKISLNT